MAKRIVAFNHKGGVSKTTTVYNIGWMLSKDNRVLIVDGDPQCNLTSLLLREDFEKFYVDDATKTQNIKDGVSSAFKGRPTPITPVNCFSPQRAPNLYLLAGHANLSEFDAALTFAQTSNNAIATLQNLPGAFNELIRLVEEKYQIDYTIIDLNPGLSAINQNLFLNSDFFVIPTNPDPFSIMALETLKTIIPRWAGWKSTYFQSFEDSAYPLRPGIPCFVGSFIQRFNVRNGKAAKPYRDNIDDIKLRVSGDLLSTLQRASMALPIEAYSEKLRDNKLCLGEIADFGGLLPKAYSAGVPVFDLTDDELDEKGVVFEGLKEKRTKLYEQFKEITSEIVKTTNYA